MKLITANSIMFEAAHITAQYCSCGGRYQADIQRLVIINDQPIDYIAARCERCGETRDFFFDIHTFYDQDEPARATDDPFQATEAALREAGQAIKARRWDEAEKKLHRVLDPQAGEPDFGWGHYHLGMVYLVQERYERGWVHIQRAIELIPHEAEFYRGASKALARLDHKEEAAQAIEQYEVLKARNQG
jgi:tetratricopeptide (TPR) repeat protein